MGITVDKEKCTGCGNCVTACPFGLIDVKDEKAHIRVEGCNLCGACKDACAFEAIEIEKPVAEKSVSGEYHGVWVFAEQRNGEIKSVAYELLAKGR